MIFTEPVRRRLRPVFGVIAGSGLVLLLLAAPRAHGDDPGARPVLRVADASQGCPSVSGTFVALLDPDRGMLLLSGAGFPGAKRVGQIDGRVLRAELGARPWSVAAVGSDGGAAPVWGEIFPFRNNRVRGCVAFDKERFSSKGDLASYLGWLVEEIYAGFPDEERERFPAFRLSNRRIRLEISLDGYGPMPLEGDEGATLAFKVPETERIFLLMPFVLADDEPRAAVRVSYSDDGYWSKSPKPFLGTVIVASDLPATIGDPPFAIRLVDIR